MSKDFDPNAFIEKTNNFDPTKFATSGSNEESPTLDALKAIGVSIPQGILMSGLDEVVGGIGAASEIPSVITGKRSISDLGKLYREYQQLAEKNIKEIQEKSPKVSFVSEAAGGLLPLVGSGGASVLAEAPSLTKIGKAALTGMGFGGIGGGLSSEHTVEDKPSELTKDIISGAALGGIIGGGASAIEAAIPTAKNALIKKVEKFTDEHPQWRQAVEYYKRSKADSRVNPRSGSSAETRIANEGKKKVGDIVESIIKEKDIRGDAISSLIREAETQGKIIDVNDIKDNSLNLLEQIKSGNYLKPDDLSKFEMAMERIKSGKLNPTEAYSLYQDLGKLANDASVSGNKALSEFSKDFRSDLLKKLSSVSPELPEYISKYRTFLEPFEDTFLGGKKFRDIEKPSELLKAEMRELITKSESGGQKSSDIRDELNKFFNRVQDLENETPGTIERLGFKNLEEFRNKVRNIGDVEAGRRYFEKEDPSTGFLSSASKTVKKLISGGSETGRGTTIGVASGVGALQRNVADFSRSITNAPIDVLNKISNKLSSNPSHREVGTRLKQALDSNDITLKNAMIFKIMQSPVLRDQVKDLFSENNPTE